MTAGVKKPSKPQRGLGPWVTALLVAGFLTYLVTVVGLAVGVEWFGPLAWQRFLFPFADPGASAAGSAFLSATLVATGTWLVLRRRQGAAGALFTVLLLLVPTAAVIGWFLHAVNALPDRSPERRVTYQVVGYRDGRKSLLHEVVLEPVDRRQAVLRRCVGPGLLGGWPPPGARVDLRTRAGVLGWRWIAGFAWDPKQYPALARRERGRFLLERHACEA